MSEMSIGGFLKGASEKMKSAKEAFEKTTEKIKNLENQSVKEAFGTRGAKEVLENKSAKELAEAKTNENEQVETNIKDINCSFQESFTKQIALENKKIEEAIKKTENLGSKGAKEALEKSTEKMKGAKEALENKSAKELAGDFTEKIDTFKEKAKETVKEFVQEFIEKIEEKKEEDSPGLILRPSPGIKKPDRPSGNI